MSVKPLNYRKQTKTGKKQQKAPKYAKTAQICQKHEKPQ